MTVFVTQLFSSSGPKSFSFFSLDLFHAFYDLVSVFSFWLSKKIYQCCFFFSLLSPPLATLFLVLSCFRFLNMSITTCYGIHILIIVCTRPILFTNYYSLFCILESMDLLMTLRKYKCVHRACMTRYLQDCKALHASLN